MKEWKGGEPFTTTYTVGAPTEDKTRHSLSLGASDQSLWRSSAPRLRLDQCALFSRPSTIGLLPAPLGRHRRAENRRRSLPWPSTTTWATDNEILSLVWSTLAFELSSQRNDQPRWASRPFPLERAPLRSASARQSCPCAGIRPGEIEKHFSISSFLFHLGRRREAEGLSLRCLGDRAFLFSPYDDRTSLVK